MSGYSRVVDDLTQKNDTKIVFFIWDGLGGLHMENQDKTELQTASTPHLDALALRSSCGFILPVAPGITPGSGPAHFALFGYDPLEANIGRGVLEAAGIGFELSDRDLAVRCNFATIDDNGNILDRRAGRISTEENKRICRKLRDRIQLEEAEVFIEPIKEHRLLVVFRADDLNGNLRDTDPQETGVPPLEPKAEDQDSKKAEGLIRSFLKQTRDILADEAQANMLTMRGFAKHKPYPSLSERFGLEALCIANYPMYRGISQLVGMDLHPVTESVETQLDALEKRFQDYDFFFIHVKSTDKTGEDGDFAAKVTAIEKLDALLPRLEKLEPDVLVITGDHSTPSALSSHSWHPVPVLLHSRYARLDLARRLDELECLKGALGQLLSKDLMALALAHAERLQKFGA